MTSVSTDAGPSAAADPIAFSRIGLVFNLAITALDVGVATVVYQLARHAGASESAAYLLGGVGPLLGGLAVWLRTRDLSGASIAVLAFNLLSAAAALIGGRQPDLLLYKDAVATGLIGLIFAGSLLLPRPLAFYFGQRYATNGTHEAALAWRGMWRYRDFRRGNYAVTVVWAATFCAEAATKALLVHLVDFDTAYTVNQVLPWAATAFAIVLTIALTRHYHSRA